MYFKGFVRCCNDFSLHCEGCSTVVRTSAIKMIHYPKYVNLASVDC
jgi:hypothetical protein